MAKTTATLSSALKQDYQEFLQKAADLFPKADQKLILSMLYYETLYSYWEGNVLLKVVYPSGADMERKKRWCTAGTNACLLLSRTRLSGSRLSGCILKNWISS